MLEKTMLDEVNKITKTFDYNLVDVKNNTAVLGMYAYVVRKVIQDQRLLSSESILHVKGNLERKRKRNTTVQDYSKNLDENVLYQLYKYADVINLFYSMQKHSNEMKNFDYNMYLDMLHAECKKSIENIANDMRSNQAVLGLVQKYEKTSISDKEYDYVCATLMVNVLLCTMDFVLYGHIESDGQKFPIYTLTKTFSVEENITAINTVIMNEVVKCLTYSY